MAIDGIPERRPDLIEVAARRSLMDDSRAAIDADAIRYAANRITSLESQVVAVNAMAGTIADMAAQVKHAERERDNAREDVDLAAGELMVDITEAPPGSLAARLLAANSIMRRERDEAQSRARYNAIHVSRLAAACKKAEAERDGLHAYAAFLQCQGTTKSDFQDWTPAEAVAWVQKVADGTHPRLAWRKNEQINHDQCIEAVRAYRLRDAVDGEPAPEPNNELRAAIDRAAANLRERIPLGTPNPMGSSPAMQSLLEILCAAGHMELRGFSCEWKTPPPDVPSDRAEPNP